MSAEQKLRSYSTDELRSMAQEYRDSNERGQFTWKIEEIESEIHRRATDTTIALDEQRGMLIVRTTEDRVGRTFRVGIDEGQS